LVNSSVYDSDAYVSDDGLLLYFGSNRPGGSGDWDMWVTTRETAQDPWGEPVNLGPQVNSSDNESGTSIPADGLSLFFDSDRTGGYGGRDLWVTTRVTKDEP
ncbi:MAG: hypothetical protein GTO40_16280, partial [Deltaproteobacteria bacterium]|nr:hypothetical protein [Deltaproteobacteria bacterium]